MATVSIASWSQKQTEERKSSQMATSDLISGQKSADKPRRQLAALMQQDIEFAPFGGISSSHVSVSLLRSTGSSRNDKSPPVDTRCTETCCLDPKENALPSVGRRGEKKKLHSRLKIYQNVSFYKINFSKIILVFLSSKAHFTKVQ